MFGATFRDIKAGDVVRFRLRSGTRLVGGRSEPRFAVRSAKANPLLLFETHVVVNHGPFGEVVDERNYVGHTAADAGGRRCS